MPPPSFLSHRSTRNSCPSIAASFLQISACTPRIMTSMRLLKSSTLLSKMSGAVRGSAINVDVSTSFGFSRAERSEIVETAEPIPMADAPKPRRRARVLLLPFAQKTRRKLILKAIAECVRKINCQYFSAGNNIVDESVTKIWYSSFNIYDS